MTFKEDQSMVIHRSGVCSEEARRSEELNGIPQFYKPPK